MKMHKKSLRNSVIVQSCFWTFSTGYQWYLIVDYCLSLTVFSCIFLCFVCWNISSIGVINQVLLLYFTFYLCWACFVCICVAFLCVYVAFVLCLCILGGISTIREGIALHPPLSSASLIHFGTKARKWRLNIWQRNFWHLQNLTEPFFLKHITIKWYHSLLYLAPHSLYPTPPPLRKITIRTWYSKFCLR